MQQNIGGDNSKYWWRWNWRGYQWNIFGDFSGILEGILVEYWRRYHISRIGGVIIVNYLRGYRIKLKFYEDKKIVLNLYVV